MVKKKVFLTGDTHIPIDISKLNSKNFPQQKELSKNDYVIILGDFGLLWKHEPDATEKYWTKWLNKKPWTTLFLCGNHENFDKLNSLPEIKMFGSKVGQVSSSIFHLKRGNIYDINNKKILTIGGAESVDKLQRTIGLSWWSAELLSRQDIYNALDNIDIHNKTVDYVLSHTCPTEAFKYFPDIDGKGNDPTMRQLEVIKDELNKFKHWFFGHFHVDLNINKKFTCIFQDVIRID